MRDHRELLTPESAAPYGREVVFLRDARNGLEHTCGASERAHVTSVSIDKEGVRVELGLADRRHISTRFQGLVAVVE